MPKSDCNTSESKSAVSSATPSTTFSSDRDLNSSSESSELETDGDNS